MREGETNTFLYTSVILRISGLNQINCTEGISQSIQYFIETQTFVYLF